MGYVHTAYDLEEKLGPGSFYLNIFSFSYLAEVYCFRYELFLNKEIEGLFRSIPLNNFQRENKELMTKRVL